MEQNNQLEMLEQADPPFILWLESQVAKTALLESIALVEQSVEIVSQVSFFFPIFGILNSSSFLIIFFFLFGFFSLV